MKQIIVLFLILKLCKSVNVPKDNHHYKEGESQYFWSFDTSGEATLVDLKTKPDQRVLDAHVVSNWIQFWLFRRGNVGKAPIKFAVGNLKQLQSTPFKAEDPLNLLIHDWDGEMDSLDMKKITEAILYRSDCNVIIVDWKTAAKSFVTAAHAVPNVASYTSLLMKWLVEHAQTAFTRIHIIGIGMGAHIAGMTGRKLGGQVSRITALDPTGPLFNSELSSSRVTSNDARYVEGIHTTFGLTGSQTTVGRADFFPNGGFHPQPRCNDVGCSHNRAYEYYVSSLVFDNMVGKKCISEEQARMNIGCKGPTAKMGTIAYKKSLDGNFHMYTKGFWPYF